MENKDFSRRSFLRNSLLVTGGLFIAPVIVSCSSDDNHAVGFTPKPDTTVLKNFDFGVASFDPSATSVIIWTRYNVEGKNISWEIAKDKDFKEVLRQGVVLPSAVNDNTIAIEIEDLPSYTKLYYRFFNVEDNSHSVVGETLTLPAKSDAIAEVKMAVASCSNFPAGLFHVYKEIAESDVDVVLHLGDYIYEYEVGGYGTNASTAVLGRAHQPSHEILTLEDYRTRYKQYRGDKNLQLAHQLKPFICVWDDHEIANDVYRDGAENHDEAKEGSFEMRKKFALQAYSEYIPLKTGKDTRIYRSFDFGNILSLHMLDTRVIARDKQLDYVNYYTASGFDQQRFINDFTDPSRKLLGDEQLSWLGGQLNSSSATWQVLGQQVLMGKMQIPSEFLGFVQAVMKEVTTTGAVSQATMGEITKLVFEFVMLKETYKQAPSALTPEQIKRITEVLPYNLDAWDGYPVEREKLFALFQGKKVINLAGDTHNAWFNEMKNAKGEDVGYELATSSVSSPGMEHYLGLGGGNMARTLEDVLKILVDELTYVDLSRRGYLHLNFDSSNVKAEWRFVSSVHQASYDVEVGHQVVL